MDITASDAYPSLKRQVKGILSRYTLKCSLCAKFKLHVEVE